MTRNWGQDGNQLRKPSRVRNKIRIGLDIRRLVPASCSVLESLLVPGRSAVAADENVVFDFPTSLYMRL